MNPSFLWSQGTLTGASEETSLVHLFKSGIQCFRAGRYAEGLALFPLARESLAPNYTLLNTVLDGFIQSHMAYTHGQEELLKACKHFTQSDAEQQIQIVALDSLLPILEEETDKAL